MPSQHSFELLGRRGGSRNGQPPVTDPTFVAHAWNTSSWRTPAATAVSGP